jgi:uncharacterized damage-inducible protein DinB
MSPSVLADAFAHHSWATLRLIDACRELGPEQLATSVPGTYGSILATIRHVVGADAGYLNLLTQGAVPSNDEETMDLEGLRAASAGHGKAWASLVGSDVDPATMVVRHRDDGSGSHAPMGIRLAQAIHHGTDHRSQICTALTTLGIEPPEIDVWAFAQQDGRIAVVWPQAQARP